MWSLSSERGRVIPRTKHDETKHERFRAGSYVSVPALIAAPGTFVVLLLAKMATKIAGVYPVTRQFGSPRGEGMYTTLLMSTGLTVGSISALYGLTHHIVDAAQYSYLVAAVIGSAVVPTLIANAFFLPHHLLAHKAGPAVAATPAASKASEGEPR